MYKIGDKVLYKDSTTVRSIRDINEKGELLLWGMYEYTDPKNVTNTKKNIEWAGVKMYRKKPVVIKAFRTDEEMEIETLEGTMKANVGDWIIRGVNGEVYPCKDDIFIKTYDVAIKETYKDRLKKEYEELSKKYHDLGEFLDRYKEGTLKFELAESKLEKLQLQFSIMASYIAVLEERMLEEEIEHEG